MSSPGQSKFLMGVHKNSGPKQSDKYTSVTWIEANSKSGNHREENIKVWNDKVVYKCGDSFTKEYRAVDNNRRK